MKISAQGVGTGGGVCTGKFIHVIVTKKINIFIDYYKNECSSWRLLMPLGQKVLVL